MPDKSWKINWKKRLEAMQQGQASQPSQTVDTSPAPPAKELFVVKQAPIKQPEPRLEPGPQSESDTVQEVRPREISQEPPMPLPDPQAGRLEKLARQVRSLKIMALGALSLAILLFLGLALLMNLVLARSSRISADTLAISDAKGISRAWIGLRDGQVCIELRDQAGERRLSLGLDTVGEPRLIFYTKDQQILTEIVPLPDGQTGIELLNQAGDPVVTIPAPSSSAPETLKPQVIDPLPKPIFEPEKALEENPKAEPKPDTNPESAAKADTTKFFVANPGGKAYHLPNCSWVKDIPLDKLLKFSSAVEAAKAGYHPCRRCRPEHKDVP